MNKGLIFRLGIGERGSFYATFFNLFHVGISTQYEPTFSTMLILGFWKLEVGIMLAKKYEKKMDLNNHGIS